MQSIKVVSNFFKLKSEKKNHVEVPLKYGCNWEVDRGSRQRASLIYFIKYLTYLHLGQIDKIFIWLLYRFRRFFSSFLSHCLTWKPEN